jgi:hypothetical protein
MIYSLKFVKHDKKLYMAIQTLETYWHKHCIKMTKPTFYFIKDMIGWQVLRSKVSDV